MLACAVQADTDSTHGFIVPQIVLAKREKRSAQSHYLVIYPADLVC